MRVALIGLPNCGKSTLFNRLVGERMAIVDDTPGTTRDRLFGEAEWNGRTFNIVDTGGIDPSHGGKTPLSAGLFMAHQVIQRERNLHPDVNPLLILLTDGAGNVSMTNLPPQEEAHALAEQIAEEKIRSVVINMEHAAFDQGLAQALADHLKAPCYTLSELKAEALYKTVREEMDSGRKG